MPDIGAELGDITGFAQRARIIASGIEHLIHHDDPSPSGDAAAVTETMEEPDMSVFTEGKQLLHDGLAKLETFDDDALGALEAISGNPEAMALLKTAAAAVGVPGLAPGVIAGAESVLKIMTGLVPAPAAVQPPESGDAPASAVATDPRQFGQSAS